MFFSKFPLSFTVHFMNHHLGLQLNCDDEIYIKFACIAMPCFALNEQNKSAWVQHWRNCVEKNDNF